MQFVVIVEGLHSVGSCFEVELIRTIGFVMILVEFHLTLDGILITSSSFVVCHLVLASS